MKSFKQHLASRRRGKDLTRNIERTSETSAFDKLHRLNKELRHHKSGKPLSPEQSKQISSTTPTPEELKQLNLFSRQSGISGFKRPFTLYRNRRPTQS